MTISEKIGTPRNKFLLFTSAGDRSNLLGWLEGSRNFDLWVAYYGDEDQRFRDLADHYIQRKGGKFPNLHYVYERWRSVLDRYDAIMVLDDDILIDGSALSRLFEIRQEHGLWLLQPSFDLGSKISHWITRTRPFSRLRYTNFVELGCPLFQREKLDRFMEVYDPVLVGWGIDYWYLDVLGHDVKGKVAIVDEIACVNPHDNKKGEREIDRLQPTDVRISTWQRIKTFYGINRDRVPHVEYGYVPLSSVTDKASQSLTAPDAGERESTPQIEQIMNDALAHHGAGRLQEAEAAYEQVLRHDSQHGDALHYLGVIAYQQGHRDMAQQLIRHAIMLSPATAAMHNNLGEVLTATRQFDQAVGCYKEAIRLDADQADAHYNLGRVLYLMGQFDEALNAYREALQRRPDMPEAHNNLGLMLADQQRYEEAIQCYQAAIQHRPDYAEAYNNLGTAYLKQDKFDEAKQAFLEASRLNPRLKEARTNFKIADVLSKGRRTLLYVNYYVDNVPERQKEIETCLASNINNPNIDRVLVLVANSAMPRLLTLIGRSHPKVVPVVIDHRPTFNDYFRVVNNYCCDRDINIVTNSDIYLDQEAVNHLLKADLRNKVFALSRWDVQEDGCVTDFARNTSQDTWVWQGKLQGVNADFLLGKLACDNRVAHAFAEAGYALSNPCKTIKTYHLHMSRVRNYNEDERLGPPYVLIEPTEL